MNFEGVCRERNCRRYLQAHKGLFGTNYWSRRGSFTPCLGAWCPPCYTPMGTTLFLVTEQVDDEGGIITSEREQSGFKETRGGDHLLTPFQCDTCYFRNIYAWDLGAEDLRDIETLKFIRQVALDSLWSREPMMVKNNLQEAKRGQKSAKRFGFPDNSATPPMGPFPLVGRLWNEGSFGSPRQVIGSRTLR
jgi:hypothetical protein